MSHLFGRPSANRLLRPVCVSIGAALLATVLLAPAAVAEESGLANAPCGESQKLIDSSSPCPFPLSAEPAVGRFWASGEYLLWWFKDAPLPTPLLTTGPFAARSTGALNQPGTEVLLGGAPVAMPVHSGLRIFGGSWLDEGNIGAEAGYLYVAPASRHMQIGTSGLPGSPNLAVPYFDNNGAGRDSGTPGETVFVLPGPLQFNGQAISGFQGTFGLSVSDYLQGAEASGVLRGFRGEHLSLDTLLGFRWLEMQESVSLSATTMGVPGGIFAGQFYNLFDRFGARTDFYGGQLGVRGEYRRGRAFVQAGVKAALGDAHQTASVDGASQTSSGNLFFHTAGTSALVFPGGVFAQPTNIGLHARNTFSALADVSVNVGYELTPWARLFLGYNYLALSNVARPGDQIDRVINSTRTSLAALSQATAGGPPPSGPAAPTFLFHDTSFWAQGLVFGLGIRF